jgi:tetrapyrrole methylase family protein/MazG family protein
MSSPDAGQRFQELLSIMARLRGPDGCPWDREQTAASLRPCLVEETYEVLDALDTGDAAELREELGDLLLQVVFHAELAREQGQFEMKGVLDTLVAKLIRRHPHVFGTRSVRTAAEALAQWETIKSGERERSGRSAIDGIPRSLPALLRAERVQQRAARVGFDWPDATSATDKVGEELGEVLDALGRADVAATERELGDLLFAAVNVARLAAVDPERALKSAVERFERRFASMEEAARTGGRELSSLSPGELEELWVQAKSREGSS